ncbi:RNA 2',3'-cyclic phosphodiesterase [Desulfonauticus submarinus]
MMRVFLGLPVDKDFEQAVVEQLGNWKNKFKSRLSWIKKGNYHLTLKFLGDVEENVVEKLKQELLKVEFMPFNLQVKKIGFFYSQRKVRVVWIGFQEELELKDYFSKIDGICFDLGFEQEKREYIPHLTLARVKFFEPSDPWKNFQQALNKFEWPQLKLKKLVLWQSKLTPQGPFYTPLLELK